MTVYQHRPCAVQTQYHNWSLFYGDVSQRCEEPSFVLDLYSEKVSLDLEPCHLYPLGMSSLGTTITTVIVVVSRRDEAHV